MHLKSLTLKGFKSFPDRTRLDFGPGVSVVVGPNGSGKSNITDAVLWAMGEQSPLAVRGSSMQDVIFGGAPGVQARRGAEVEIVLENADGAVDLPFGEISIVRTLDRTGEGSYRLNGARCRLTDVIEALSDTGLGKETHSVISQGRVEEIVTSKPRDRRLLIEEAAGLGKHRKRRRRAQLKLERTQQNLDRALDVEREARTRLRPLKRQAEAAELHARLERQMLEARMELARDSATARAVELEQAEAHVAEARTARGEVESALAVIVERRGRAERALAERAQRHDALARRAYDARAAQDRLGLRGEQAHGCARELAARVERVENELASLDGAGERERGVQGEGSAHGSHIPALKAELAKLQAEHERELGHELAELERAEQSQRALVEQLERDAQAAREARERADDLEAKAREGSAWSSRWQEVRRVIVEGVERVLGMSDAGARSAAAGEVAAEAERLAREVLERSLKGVRAAEETRERLTRDLAEAERRLAEAGEELRRGEWSTAQRRAAAEQGPLALRRAQLEGELAAEHRQAQQRAEELERRERRAAQLRVQHSSDRALLPRAERLAAVLERSVEAITDTVAGLEGELSSDSSPGEEMAGELGVCAAEEAEIQAQLRSASESVTAAEVAAQRVRDQAAEAEMELRGVAEGLGIAIAEIESDHESTPGERLDEDQLEAIGARVERLERRREQLGPVNPLAEQEYAEALAHVGEMEAHREDLEGALRELRRVIAETDRRIQRSFDETFRAAADNFELLAGDLFPGGSGRLRLVEDTHSPRSVLGGASAEAGASDGGGERSDGEGAGTALGGAHAEREHGAGGSHRFAEEGGEGEGDGPGVEIEITPAGKSTKRLSLLSGGEKSMTALAFLFAVFLARPCPFYILDEVEAALDDLNLDRFLALLRRYSDRSQFIVITHQKRTMEAADWLYGVSMGANGVSRVLSRRLPSEPAELGEIAQIA